MYKNILFVFLLTFAACTQPADENIAETPASQMALFNGTDFKGWTHFLADSTVAMEEVWHVDPDSGIIICKGEPWGYLRTIDQYEDFILDLDWRWNPETRQAGNSGVFVRVTGPDKQWPRCIEAQLMSGSAGDFVLMDGMELQTDTTRMRSERPHVRFRSASNENPVGEWNNYIIRVEDGTITVHVNGLEVNQGTGIPPGAGYIALQSEGGEIQFRNIRLTRLD